jgi:hypothetical protein
MLTDLEVRPSDATSRPSQATSVRTPIFIVCSPRPRVGRTLIARLLVDYLVSDGRAPLVFDANPYDPVLSAYQPEHAVQATLADIKGEMALFDRLIICDGQPKVIDLAPDQFEGFFACMETIAFVDSARADAIDTIALYIAEAHPHAEAALCHLTRRFPTMTVVPVVNDMLFPIGAAPPPFPEESAPALRIAALPPLLHGVIMRAHFSITRYFSNDSNRQTSLYRWIANNFIGFRNIELRLRMAQFALLLEPLH